MDNVFWDIKAEGWIIIYMDNIFIFIKELGQNIKDTKQTLQQLQENDLYLKYFLDNANKILRINYLGKRQQYDRGMLKPCSKDLYLNSILQKHFFFSPYKILFSLSFIFISPFPLMSSYQSLPIQSTHLAISQTPYPPPIIVKHHTWYHEDADLFISIWGIDSIWTPSPIFSAITIFQEYHGQKWNGTP